jgi:acetyl-CoA carboxylase biotin carboxylase subunit
MRPGVHRQPGGIALRIVRACRKLGLECVVRASELDRDGLAARTADPAVTVGPGLAGQSYLRPEVIVEAALGTGCDAIHPGYGFLAENPPRPACRCFPARRPAP